MRVNRQQFLAGRELPQQSRAPPFAPRVSLINFARVQNGPALRRLTTHPPLPALTQPNHGTHPCQALRAVTGHRLRNPPSRLVARRLEPPFSLSGRGGCCGGCSEPLGPITNAVTAWGT